MKSKALSILAIAALSACGGGGGGTAGSVTTPSLELSGTTATGLALAASTVSAKCATGTATGQTGADGAYTLSIENGALPCVLQVKGSVDGVEVVLHSVTEAGTVDGSKTSASANITPLTEMVVARLTGALPSGLFQGFDSSTAGQITTAALNTATTEVATALKGATGIDLGTIDPFKTKLVAATSSAPAAGNQYDKLLDSLKEKVKAESLPLVVNQIAAAAKNADASASGAQTLAEVMAAVEKGSLQGCPTVVSGKYRMIDYWGRTRVRDLDFKNNKFNRDNGEPLFDITPDANQACQFKVAGTSEGQQSEFDVAFGPSGVGTYRSRNLTTNGAAIGYIFPVQKHAVASIAGNWTFVQSGYMPGDGVRHYLGKMSFNTSGAVSTFCDYEPANQWACVTPTDIGKPQVSEGSDHGFMLNDGDDAEPLYAYRAPNGSFTLFGTTNPTGATGADVEQTHYVAFKEAALSLPAVGAVTKSWDATLTRVRQQDNTVVNFNDFGTSAYTVLATDAAAGSYSRERASDGRQDMFKINHPVAGMRLREATTWNNAQIPGMIAMSFPGLGLGVGVSDGSGRHFYSISVNRP